MAYITSIQSGPFGTGSTWTGGIVPTVGDTAAVSAGHVVTLSSGTQACDQVVVLGEYYQSGGQMTTAEVDCPSSAGDFRFEGSGDNNNPTLLYTNKLDFRSSCGVYMEGTESQWEPENFKFDAIIETTTPAGATIVTNNNAHRGNIDYVCIKNFQTQYYMINWQNFKANTSLTVGSMYFYQCGTSSYGWNVVKINFSGTIWFDGGATAGVGGQAPTYCMTACCLFGTGKIRVVNAPASKNQLFNSYFFDTTSFRHEEPYGYVNFTIQFADSTDIDIVDANYLYVLRNGTYLGDGDITITEQLGSAINLFRQNTVQRTGGTITATVKTGPTTVNNACQLFEFKNMILDCVGTIYFVRDAISPCVFQMTRDRLLRIKNATTVNQFFATGSAAQPEPIDYYYGDDDTDARITWSLQPNATNYSTCYGESTGWTPTTNTLADGGRLVCDMLGIDGSLPILDLSNFATSIAGTLSGSEVIRYQISFNGGADYSAELTEAELQANAYTINGDSFATSPRYEVYLKIIIKNTTGSIKTITRVDNTGMGCDSTAVVTTTLEDRLIDNRNQLQKIKNLVSATL